MSITTLKKHVTQIISENAKVHPGQPFKLNKAASIGDGVWQGDLGIEVINPKNLKNYKKVKPQVQLVPGNTVGSKHTIKDLATISNFQLPTNWKHTEDYEGLFGPSFLCKAETTIEHPTHGNVIIAAGHYIQCRYQRQFDLEQQRERRALD